MHAASGSQLAAGKSLQTQISALSAEMQPWLILVPLLASSSNVRAGGSLSSDLAQFTEVVSFLDLAIPFLEAYIADLGFAASADYLASQELHELLDELQDAPPVIAYLELLEAHGVEANQLLGQVRGAMHKPPFPAVKHAGGPPGPAAPDWMPYVYNVTQYVVMEDVWDVYNKLNTPGTHFKRFLVFLESAEYLSAQAALLESAQFERLNDGLLSHGVDIPAAWSYLVNFEPGQDHP